MTAASGLVVLFIMNRCAVNRTSAYILVGTVVWAAVLKSGVYATLAGFVVAWFIPLKVRNEDSRPTAQPGACLTAVGDVFYLAGVCLC